MRINSSVLTENSALLPKLTADVAKNEDARDRRHRHPLQPRPSVQVSWHTLIGALSISVGYRRLLCIDLLSKYDTLTNGLRSNE